MKQAQSPGRVEYVNNHIHTTYSFSPYTPSAAISAAKSAGLLTAGIMDHDTVAGATEFTRAGKAAGIATTVGLECRCSMSGTPFEGMRLNNPDQRSIAYFALHGIPNCALSRVQEFITPYRAAREERGKLMTERLDEIFSPYGIELEFERDVKPISYSSLGGTITERHILFALTSKLISSYGAGAPLLNFLSEHFGINVAGKLRETLEEPGTSHYQYYLLGLLKAFFIGMFYIDAKEELPHVTDFIKLAGEAGAIAAYPYLGDVRDSVTGDKKDAEFEDSYLDDLVAWLKTAGFHAITYMPTRNSPAQLTRLMALCEHYGFFQISGEDINTPFQSFICKALEDPRYIHLVDSTWALIGHEREASEDPGRGMFSHWSVADTPDLNKRIRKYANIGRGQ